VGPGARRLIIGQRRRAGSGWGVGLDWVCFGFVFFGLEGGCFCVKVFGVRG